MNKIGESRAAEKGALLWWLLSHILAETNTATKAIAATAAHVITTDLIVRNERSIDRR
jgi:hypothetical protein